MAKNNTLKIVSYFVVGLALASSVLLFGKDIVKYFRVNSFHKEVVEVPYPVPKYTDHYRVKNESSRITLVNYISLDCPHCKQAFLDEDTFLNSIATSSRNINILYRHNPLASQPLSQEKALISECVYRETDDSVFFEFIKTVFTTYDEAQKDNLWVTQIAYKMIPSQKVFDACMHDKTVLDVIQKQKYENVILDIRYTPTILVFVDGGFIKKYENLNARTVLEILKYYNGISKPTTRK